MRWSSSLNQFSKYIPFGTLAILILIMMVATALEKVQGTPVALRAVYHNPVFIILWAVLAVSGMYWLMKRGVQKRYISFGLHISFVIILTGALITFLFGEKGSLYLGAGESADRFFLEDGNVRNMPFSLRLDDFSILYHSGTRAASDYRSSITILPEGMHHEISMNHILKYKGYRFCQASFDEEVNGCTLSVVHDPWGIGVTYAGYLMLLVSMLGFFFCRDTDFRAAVRRVLQSSMLVTLFFISVPVEAAQQPENMPKVLPEEVADAFGDLYVYYNDRICPLSTLFNDYCLKAYGKVNWNSLTPNQVITGWLFYYDWWRVIPFRMQSKGRGTADEEEKEYLQRRVAAGDAFRIFPIADAEGNVAWYSCNESLPPEVLDDYELWAFVRKSLDLVEESVRHEDWNEVLRLIGKIKTYQEKTAGNVLPSQLKVRAEQLYNDISRPKVPFVVSVTLGLILFAVYGTMMTCGKSSPKGLQVVAAVFIAVLCFYLTLVLGLRWYVSGNAPFVGSYCVMMLMALLACIGTLLMYRRFPLLLPMCFLIAGFTMSVASLTSSNPQITHIMPVLQSPLLSIHVLSMMMSYTLLGIVALCGLMGLIIPADGLSERLRDFSLVLLYPAVFLLTSGTFLGAVWANVSWGSYWSWDPKETWALITLLIYAVALHGGCLKAFRNPRFFHAYCIIGFLSVLVTYFGVNLLLGGMHAYA